MPEAYGELARVFDLLETHYRDMQDIEFTVERGKLWMLQTRSGKRTAKAALKMAVDMVDEGLIDDGRGDARGSIRWRSTSCCTRRSIPRRARDVLAKGLAGFAGCGFGRDRARCRYRRKVGRTRRRGDPGPRRNQPRGHSRDARGQGHPDRARRHDQPRSGGRARHGPALRFGRWQPSSIDCATRTLRDWRARA